LQKNSDVKSRDYFSLRLAAFYATLGLSTGVGMPFFPIWLEGKGVTFAEIGMILATPMVVRIFFVPLATRLADRFNMWRGAMLIGSIGAAAGNAWLDLVNGFFPLMAVIVVAAVFFTPTFPLTDAYALRGLAERGRAYGPVRLWSSAAFIVANVGAGSVIGLLGRESIIWMMVSAYVAGALIVLFMAPATPHHELHIDRPAPAKSMWRSPAFVAIIVACALVQSSHAFYYGFSTIAWTGKGLSDTVVGALWAIGVIVEVILFAVSGWLSRYIGPVAMVVLGAAGAVVRWSIMAFDPPLASLPLLQCLHALSFGATHIGAMQFLARVAPAGSGATVQGDFAAAQAIVFAGAMGGSGVLFRAYGDFGYAAMALLAIVGFVIAFAAYAARPRER
jgi:PPP family 3-phenylpropionic acid transporter